MPVGATASGEAFELLASRYLSNIVGLDHVAAPLYTRLERGRWVQFDGLFARRDGNRLVLEAKFYGEPISLSTPGISARVTFAKEAGVRGLILASRAGFAGDILRVRLPIEKVLLSWKAMHTGLAKKREKLLTAGLDPVVHSARGYTAQSGATLITTEDLSVSNPAEGFGFLPANVERWLRRIPASPDDINPLSPPRRFRTADSLDIVSAWTVEDSLRGFAPAAPKLLEMAVRALSNGPIDLIGAWKALWKLGYRGRKGGLKNALDDLVVMGVAEKFRTERGLFYGPWFGRPRTDAAHVLADALRRWPAFVYFKPFVAADRNKHSLSASLAERFAPLFPYARSLYNPAKVAGLLALDDYVSGTSTTSPS